MLAIAEEILKLPRDEKIKILQTLQENIAMDDDMAENGNVSAEIMTELKKRAAMVETGEATWIEKEELLDYLKKRRNTIKDNYHQFG